MRSLIFVVSFLFVIVTTAHAALNPIALMRWEGPTGHSPADQARVVARAQEILHFLDGRAKVSPCQKGTTAEDFLSKAGTTAEEFKEWHLVPVTESIDASAVAGVDPATGKITWGRGHQIPVGVWALTNEPRKLVGGEEVTSVDLRCFNLYKHRVLTHLVTRWVRHHVTELRPPDRVVYETRYLTPRTRRVPRYYYARETCPMPVGLGGIGAFAPQLGGFAMPPSFNPPPQQVFAPQSNQGGNVTVNLPPAPPVAQPVYENRLIAPPPSSGMGFRGFTGAGSAGGGGGARGFTR